MSTAQIIDPKNALSFSSFTQETRDAFNNLSGRSILYGDRYIELDRKQSYYDCTQHNWKIWDFDGRVFNPRSTMPMLTAGASNYVPLKMRRPSTPYRLGKIIVDAFTNLLFGDNRFPQIRVDGDTDTEDFEQTIARVGRLPLAMIRARNLGGATGTAAVSWAFHQGSPRYEVHNPKNLYVHKWLDRLTLEPEHVSEVYLFTKSKWDGRKFANIPYWYRRDWTLDAEVIFKEVPYDPNNDPVWEIDQSKTVVHGDGIPHIVWIQNLPTDEIDGASDLDGLYDQLDAIDILKSVVMRGATLNLDPTLKIKMDPMHVAKMGIRKGSDNALLVGTDGDAEYLELGGQSIEAGIKLLEHDRRTILETACCIVPDPADVAAQGVSSVAIKAMFAPMIGRADIYREQYGAAIEKLVEYPTEVARKRMSTTVYFADETGQAQVDENGNPITGKFALNLPPRIEPAPKVEPPPPPPPPAPGEEPPPDDETVPAPGNDALLPPPEPEFVKTPRSPGSGGETNLRWPPYFAPTPDDQTKIVTNMQMATGGKAFLSQETAVEIAAMAFGIDPVEEQQKVQHMGTKDKAEQAAMFPPGAGGEVDDKDDLPPGAKPKFGGKPGFGGKPSPFSQEKDADDTGLDPDRGG